MQLRKAFGLSVSFERKARSLTQEQLGEKANLHFTAISMIERGERPPTLDTLELISRALGVPLSDLFRRAEELQKALPDL